MTNFISISKEESKILKGSAVLLMVIFHYGMLAANVGVACVGMFAFITGYSHCYYLNTHSCTQKSLLHLFLPFYKRFLVSFFLVYLVIYITNPGYITLTNILWTVSALKPNIIFDSWWYAFAFACYCFILFPIVKLISKLQKYSDLLFLGVLFMVAIICLALPLLFQRINIHPALCSMWGDIPCLRTIMFVPYYVIGYCLCVSYQKSSKIAFITCISIATLCICWPFPLYSINGMNCLNVAAPFVAFTLFSLFLSRINKIAFLLKWFGGISTFLWLLHMPVLFYIKKICTFHYIAIIPAFIVSVILAELFTYMYALPFRKFRIKAIFHLGNKAPR